MLPTVFTKKKKNYFVLKMLAETKATDPAESYVTFTEKTILECITTCSVKKNPLKMVDWVDGDVDNK